MRTTILFMRIFTRTNGTIRLVGLVVSCNYLSLTSHITVTLYCKMFVFIQKIYLYQLNLAGYNLHK
jgi:hypothetical protein